jgi:hypothetical protein
MSARLPDDLNAPPLVRVVGGESLAVCLQEGANTLLCGALPELAEKAKVLSPAELGSDIATVGTTSPPRVKAAQGVALERCHIGVHLELLNARQALPGGIRCKLRISGIDGWRLFLNSCIQRPHLWQRDVHHEF